MVSVSTRLGSSAQYIGSEKRNDFPLKAPTYTFKETKPGYCYIGKTNVNLSTHTYFK